MTYDEFKTYIQATLWRSNDTVLSANLDTIIRKADQELTKRTRHWERRRKTLQITPSSEDVDLSLYAPDFEAAVSVTNNQQSFYRDVGPNFERTTLNEIYAARARQIPGTTSTLKPIYAVDRDDGDWKLRLVAPYSAESPGDLTLVYRICIPDYQTLNVSWLEEEYLELYEYTVLKHCALFVREDDRIQLYKGLADEAFTIGDEDNAHNLTLGGTPLKMRSHRAVP